MVRFHKLFLIFVVAVVTQDVGGVAQEDGTLGEEDCPFGIYGPNPPNNCVCLSQGLWGVSREYCTAPLNLVGVTPKSHFCFINTLNTSIEMLTKVLSLEVPEVAQLSSSMHKLIDRFDNFTTTVPFPEDVYQHQSTLVTFGHLKWTLKTVDNETYCIVHNGNPTSEFCLFPHIRFGDKMLRIQSIFPECKQPNLPIIQSSECYNIRGNESCDDAFKLQRPLSSSSLNLDLPILNPVKSEMDQVEKNLLKRDSANETETTEDPEDADAEETTITTTKDTEDVEESTTTATETKKSEEESSPAITKKEPDTPPPQDESLLIEEEDEMSSGLDEIGHKLMRDQMDQYVDTVVAQLTGVSKETKEAGVDDGKSQGRYPILKLLDLIKMIMQKTCSPVKGEYFDLALNSFIKVQLESFHVKEPYMSPNSYKRISYALKRCYNDATSHRFHSKDPPPQELMDNCPYAPSEATSMELDVYGNGSNIVKLEPSPPSSRAIIGDTIVREPLTETVWKMLVNAHSYCYPYFKAYFNDHHALTVALLPLFNNQIQDIWLKSEGYDTSKGRLYGGLLGDTHKVLEDVDNCVAASRHVSQYPWYMSRPMKDSNNKWRRRKKRDTLSVPQSQLGDIKISGYSHLKEQQQDDMFLAPKPVFLNNGKKLCMFDPDDPVAFLGKPVCT